MRDSNTFILTPKPPAPPPQNFGGGYFQHPIISRCLIIVGSLFLFVACLMLILLGYTLYQNQEEDKQEEASRPTESEASATAIVIGLTDEPTVDATTPAPSLTITPTILVLSTSTPYSDLPSPTFTFAPPTRLAPTRTLPPSRTPLPPTITPTFTATLSPTRTSTTQPPTASQPAPTINPSGTVPPRTQTVMPSPTATEAQGRRVRLMYDNTSFYAWNMSEDDLLIGFIVFEALDADDEPTGFALYGTSWSQFYDYLERGKCMAVEITASGQWMNPTACLNYNAILTPQRTSPITFWLEREGVTEFHVLWRDEEIAQCPVGTGQCDIYIP